MVVLSRVEKKQTEWARKIDDKTEDRLVKEVFAVNVPRRMPWGRPRRRCTDNQKMN